ncbi:SLC13 family permease [Terriglobus sp. RCC_193]|uniref:SLC13 family permease n=1 Tax=Terriglobus sp. RCC_193 TaxID=3239218 RepID=UPI0035247342
MPVELSHGLLIAIVAASILLMLVRPKNLPEVWWVGPGALLLVVLRLVPLKTAGKAVAEGSDVYLFLIGMMLLSELAKDNGVFGWLSTHAVLGAHGKRSRLFALMYGVGTVVTICMSNDATAVVLTPAVLAAVKKAKVPPLPYLFACAMIANAASFVLPISNPANLVVFGAHMPPLGQWLASFGVPSVLSIAATYFVLRWYFRDDLRDGIAHEPKTVLLAWNAKVVLAGLLLVIAVLLVASGLGWQLGLPTCVAACVVVAAVSLIAKKSPLPMLKEISWTTLLLVAALFVMVRAVEAIGALDYAVAAMRWATHLPVVAGAFVVSFVVGVGNNIINNLPLGLIAGATMQTAQVQGVLSHAVLIGVDLGPNFSVTGSLATILWLLAIRKEGMHVSAWDFLKAGAIAMPVAMVAAVCGLLLVHSLGG